LQNFPEVSRITGQSNYAFVYQELISYLDEFQRICFPSNMAYTLSLVRLRMGSWLDSPAIRPYLCRIIFKTTLTETNKRANRKC